MTDSQNDSQNEHESNVHTNLLETQKTRFVNKENQELRIQEKPSQSNLTLREQQSELMTQKV